MASAEGCDRSSEKASATQTGTRLAVRRRADLRLPIQRGKEASMYARMARFEGFDTSRPRSPAFLADECHVRSRRRSSYAPVGRPEENGGCENFRPERPA